MREYPIEPEPPYKPVCEHDYRVAVGGKTVVRFCKLCGRTWLVTQLQNILDSSRFVYTWSEVLDEEEARKKLTEEHP